jgi:hypothetical protein
MYEVKEVLSYGERLESRKKEAKEIVGSILPSLYG